MKKLLMMAAMAATTISLTTSCSDDDLLKAGANVGDPIRFTASTNSMQTRTAYGELSGSKWAINWVAGDQVTVYCPDASTAVTGSSQTSDFTVESTGSTIGTSYGINGGSLYWGEPQIHRFYEVYPKAQFSAMTADSLKGETNLTVHATLPHVQNVTLQPDGSYADMSCALMAGSTTANRTSFNGSIALPFTPITTALNISISPARTSTTYLLKTLTIANVESETSPAAIAGAFDYTIGTGKITSYGADEKEQITVEFPGGGILLTPGATQPAIKVTVFLRGDFNKSVKVVANVDAKFYDTDGTTVKTTVPVSYKKQGNKDAEKLTAMCYNRVNLQDLPDRTAPSDAPGDDDTSGKPMSGEWWVSHVPSATYVSQMSLPGVYDACSFLPDQRPEDRAQDQLWQTGEDMFYGQMKAYLNAGNRVFDFKPTCQKDGNTYKWIVQRFMQDGKAYQSIDLEKMVQAADDWLKVHTTEFIVFVMSDYDWANTSSPYAAQVSNMLRSIIPERRLLESFDASISVADARGKILVVNASPCVNPLGISVSNWILNNVPTYNGKKYESGITPENRTNGHTFNFTSGGTIWVQDFNNTDNKGDKNLQDKKGYVDYSLNLAKSNTGTIPNWYYTCLPLRRVSQGEITSYSEYESTLIPYTAELVKALSNNGTYQNCGIIMQAHATKQISSTDTETLEDVIWENNYKANGPKKVGAQ